MMFQSESHQSQQCSSAVRSVWCAVISNFRADLHCIINNNQLIYAVQLANSTSVHIHSIHSYYYNWYCIYTALQNFYSITMVYDNTVYCTLSST
jgi:hypothetical protein